MRTVVIANGVPPTPALARAVAAASEMIVCADGGALAALTAGLRPDWVIGDLDSLDDETLMHLRQTGARILEYPARKDETDLELALLHAVEQGATEITVLGALGGRVDQILANLMLLALPALRSFVEGLRTVPTRIVDEQHEICLIDGQGVICGEVGDTVSLLPIAGDAVGVETDGLEWALAGGTLRFGAVRGVSNRLTQPVAHVRVASGLLLAIRLVRSPEPGPSERRLP